MENIKKRRMLDILIFFAVTVCLLAVFMPIYKALETRLIYVRDSLISKIEKEYGITIKYGSMSPSLVSKIMIKDVNLYDDKTGDKIAHFSLIHFNYRISEVIKRNPAAVISSIGIYDGVIDFNISKNKNLWGRINGGQTESGFENKTEKSADGSDGDPGKTDSQSLARRIENTITKFQNNIETSDITLRNILINYAAGPIKSELYISDGKIHAAKEKTEFNLNSKLRYLNPSFQNFSDFKTDLDISGSFYQNNLSASSIINFSNIKNGTVSIPKISIFASYLNNIVSVMTLQDIHPIDIKGSWNTERNSGSLNIECKDLQPIAIAFPNERNSVLSDLKTSEVSGFLNLSMSEKKEFSWNTNLYVKFPSFKINNGNTGTTVITLDALGDHNVIQINSFSADGENINARLSGSYKIKEVLPDFKIDVVKLKPPQMEALSFKLNIASNLKNIFADVPYLKFGEAEFNSVKTVFEKKENKTDFIFSYDDVPGKFTIDGTWIHPEKDSENKFGYLELHGAADSIGVKNIYDATQAFFEGHSEEEAAIKKFIVPLKLTSEFYISSDFKKFSYNVIQTVLASSEDDGFYALFSLTGNESSAEVGGIDVSLNKLHLTGSVNSSFENGGIVFDSLLALNDVAYKIAGLYENDTLNIYGDYGLNIHIFKSENNDLNGNFQVRELPIPFLNSVFSAEMIFDYVNAKKWDLTCNFAKLEHLKSNISKTDENFEFEIAGTANPNQVFFHTVKVGRKKSQLEGTASLSLSSGSESNLKTYAANIFVTDSDKKEKIIFDSSFSFSDTIYFDGNCSIENVSLNRFFANQKQENKINVETVFLGSPDALLIKADLKDFNYNLNGKPLTGKLTAVLDDKQIIVNDTHFSWDVHNIDNISAEISPENMAGNLSFNYLSAGTSSETKGSFYFYFNSPISSDNEKNKTLADKLRYAVSNYVITMKINDWVLFGNKGTKDIIASLNREPNITAVYAGAEDTVYGFKTDDGLVSFHIDGSLPVHLNVDGLFTKDAVELDCSDIFIDMPTVMRYIPKTDIVRFDTGEITGNMYIKGTQKDPLFYGNLIGSKITGSSPKYSPDNYGEASVPIIFDGTNLTVPYTIVPGKVGRLWAEVTSEFIGWIPYYTTIKCGTVDDESGILKTKNLAFHSDGKAKTNITIDIAPEHIHLEGDAFFDDGYFSVPFDELYKIAEKYSGNGPSFDMKLNLALGKKSEFRYPSTDYPFLRAVSYTESPMTMIVDSDSAKFEMEGSAQIRTGEIFYIKRNFFVKEGTLYFAKSLSGTEPVISLKAEIKDKLSNGEPITITLTAKDQYLDLERFNPTISTSPPMSDTERMMLLGQTAIGEANKSNVLKEVLANASDIFAQMGLVKKAEANIRNLLHLDVFSMRTLVLQNVILENLFKSSADTPLTLGNYFDNTSVYIGKYFGSAIYADATLHLSYYDPLTAKNTVRRSVYGNLLFQPEIGLEMNTPFFLLRWYVAPTRPDTMFVPDTGLTLSWKFFY